jgi:hypothetical protein
MTRIIYFNGLGDGKPRGTGKLVMNLALRYLAQHGISVVSIPVNWYSNEPFPEFLERMLTGVQDELAMHDTVTLCGVSAGGSLAVNVLGRLKSENLSVIVLCGPLRFVKKDDSLTLQRLALQNTSHPSQNLYDSVKYCSATTIPHLTPQAKQRIITVKQLADGVVPRRTMVIPGVRVTTVPGLGHLFGILVGILYLPSLVRRLQTNPPGN